MVPEVRACAAGSETWDFGKLEIMFRRVGALPALPAATCRLVAAIDSNDASTKELEQIITGDPSLAAELLRVASRSPVRLHTPISSLRQAIILLGQRSIRALAVSLSIRAIAKTHGRTRRFDSNRFVRHSMAVGIVTRYLQARSLGIRPARDDEWTAEEMFAAGVLHDISFALLAHVDPEMYDRIYDIAEMTALSLDDAFYKCFGHHACQLGAKAMEVWNFPTVFVDCQRFLHDPLGLSHQARALSCLALANDLANQSDFSLVNWEVHRPNLPPIVKEVVRVPDEEIPIVLELVAQLVEDIGY